MQAHTWQNLPLKATETMALPRPGASLVAETIPTYTGSHRAKGAIVINDISAPKLSSQLQSRDFWHHYVVFTSPLILQYSFQTPQNIRC